MRPADGVCEYQEETSGSMVWTLELQTGEEKKCGVSGL